MTPCHEDLQLLAYHDGELGPSRAREVASHVADCAACRHRLEIWRRAGSWLRADEEAREAATPSPGSWDAIRARVADVDAARTGSAAPTRPGRRETRALPGAARRRARVRRTVGIAAAASLGGLLLLRDPARPIDVIRSLDAFGAPVLVMNREDEDTTIIWMIDEQASMIDNEARMIDEQARMIDDEAPVIDEEAPMIDGEDELLEREGRPIDEARATKDSAQPGAAEAGSALAP